MATIGFVFRGGRLDLRAEHRGVERFVPTHYDIREPEWDAEVGWLVIVSVVTSRHRKLLCYQHAMARDMRRLHSAVRDMERTRAHFSVDDIASTYRQMVAGCQVLGIYAQVLADETTRERRPRTARGYMTAIRRFVDFNRGYDIRLEDLTAEIVSMFERSLEREGLTPPTISFYMRNLRTIYNKAVAENIITARLENPFDNAYTHTGEPNPVLSGSC